MVRISLKYKMSSFVFFCPKPKDSQFRGVKRPEHTERKGAGIRDFLKIFKDFLVKLIFNNLTLID